MPTNTSLFLSLIGYFVLVNGQSVQWNLRGQATYNNARCDVSSRLVSYDDVRERTPPLDRFQTPVWINAAAEYTPWMVYKGVYTIDFGSVPPGTIYKIYDSFLVGNSEVSRGEEFTECIQYCTATATWSAIGLQTRKCYCILNAQLNKTLQTSDYNVNHCRDGAFEIPYCYRRNDNVKVTVYQKLDKESNSRILNNQGTGKCLSATFGSNILNFYKSKDCADSGTKLTCITSTTNGQRSDLINTTAISSHRGYCARQNLVYPDIKALDARADSFQIANGDYWTSNFRELLFKSQRNGQKATSYCVTGKTFDGKVITFQRADCNQPNNVLCIQESYEDSTVVVTTSTRANTGSTIISTTGYNGSGSVDLSWYGSVDLELSNNQHEAYDHPTTETKVETLGTQDTLIYILIGVVSFVLVIVVLGLFFRLWKRRQNFPTYFTQSTLRTRDRTSHQYAYAEADTEKVYDTIDERNMIEENPLQEEYDSNGYLILQTGAHSGNGSIGRHGSNHQINLQGYIQMDQPSTGVHDNKSMHPREGYMSMVQPSNYREEYTQMNKPSEQREEYTQMNKQSEQRDDLISTYSTEKEDYEYMHQASQGSVHSNTDMYA